MRFYLRPLGDRRGFCFWLLIWLLMTRLRLYCLTGSQSTTVHDQWELGGSCKASSCPSGLFALWAMHMQILEQLLSRTFCFESYTNSRLAKLGDIMNFVWGMDTRLGLLSSNKAKLRTRFLSLPRTVPCCEFYPHWFCRDILDFCWFPACSRRTPIHSGWW